MVLSKADIIAKLNRELLPLQGYKPAAEKSIPELGLGIIEKAFPNQQFPLAAIHEFCCKEQQDEAATGGFIAALLSSIIKDTGTAVWISNTHNIFPPALQYFGLPPDRVIFVSMHKDEDILWAMEEALKCGGLNAVIGEIRYMSFTHSRRFQLAVEKTNTTGLIIRRNPPTWNNTASLARWEIKSMPSMLPDELPGVGFPRWQVELLKVRNGKPGVWTIEWFKGQFRHIQAEPGILHQPQKKAG